jgi:D,D-heptose 1,7-bisphosphate phosphatase
VLPAPSPGPGAPAVFLDKDGTLIEDVPYNVDPSRIVLATGAADGLRLLTTSDAGVRFRVVVVSNQSGVARGRFLEAALIGVEARLRELAAACGAELDGVYYCPHHPEGAMAGYRGVCDCRKPAPGLLLRAARERRLDLSRSWMVGDILDDVQAGKVAGCRTILLDNGHETIWAPDGPYRMPDAVAPDLASAARLILLDATRRLRADPASAGVSLAEAGRP